MRAAAGKLPIRPEYTTIAAAEAERDQRQRADDRLFAVADPPIDQAMQQRQNGEQEDDDDQVGVRGIDFAGEPHRAHYTGPPPVWTTPVTRVF